MAKRPQRTPEQQEYRDKLAHDVRNFRKYGDTGRELAQTLLDKEQMTDKYIEALGEGRKLSKEKSKELAKKLMAGRGVYIIAKNLDKFEGLDHKEIAEKLMKDGSWTTLADNLDKFEGLYHKDVVEKWMADKKEDEDSKWLRLIKYLDKFTSLDDNDRKDIAEKFLRFCENQVIKNPRLRSPIAPGYEHRGWEILVNNIDKFKGLGLDYKAITEKLMKKGYGGTVVLYIDKYKGLGLDLKWIAEKLMEYGYSGYLVSELDSKGSQGELCEGLDRKKLAEKAMEDGKWVALAYNFEKFKGLGLDQEVVEGLINKIEKEAERSKKEIEKFHGIVGDRRTLRWNALIDNLNKFEGLDHQKIVERIMNDKLRPVAYDLEKFEGPLDKWTAKRLIVGGYMKEVAKNIDKFKGLDKGIAKELIERGYGECVVDHQENFEGLSGEIEKMFIECGQGSYIAQHPEKFGLKKEK